MQYSLWKDRNYEDQNAPDEPERVVCYGRLHYIIGIELPGLPEARRPQDFHDTQYLACITPCKLDTPSDATKRVVTYSVMETTPIFIHIGVIEAGIGRIKLADGWAIIDRSSIWAHAVFNPDPS